MDAAGSTPFRRHELLCIRATLCRRRLVIHHDATDVLLRLDKYFKMKPGSIGDPDVYLGATIKQMRLTNGVMAWASSPWKYVWALVDAHKRYGVCPRRQLIHSQETTSPSWIPPRHSTQSCRCGIPLSSECSDGWLRSVEWISSRMYRRWPPKWHRRGRVTLMSSCTFSVSYQSTTTLGWRTNHRTPPST